MDNPLDKKHIESILERNVSTEEYKEMVTYALSLILEDEQNEQF
jgi:hypothetical protein